MPLVSTSDKRTAACINKQFQGAFPTHPHWQLPRSWGTGTRL